MKRFVGLLLALLLSLSLVAGAAAETFSTAYFTLTLPDGWTAETDDLGEDAEEGVEFLGYFYAPGSVGLMVEAYLVYYEELKNLALWNASESDLSDYVDAILADFADDNPVYLGTVKVGGIPFVLIKGTDEDGEYLYTDTITNGYAIELMAYVSDEDGESLYPILDEHLEQFKNILSTFQPVA